ENYEEVNDPLAHENALKAREIIERMVAKDPANLRARQQLAKSYSRLGVTFANLGRQAESVGYLEKAVAGLQTITQNESKNRRFTHDLALALMRLGDARRRERDFKGALVAFGQSISMFSSLAAGDAADNTSLRDLANARGGLAQAHEEMAAQSTEAAAPLHRRLARENYEEAIKTLRQLEARGALSKFDRKSLEKMETIAAAQK
nr:hypothetical protein [Chthoniobacterales bacterium]